MWPNPHFAADLVKFTEEILNEKLHILCSVSKTLSVETTWGNGAMTLSFQYLNKESKQKRNNCRGVIVITTLGTLFTITLRNRIEDLLVKESILTSSQPIIWKEHKT